MTADQVIDFAADARDEGVTQATLSGGDPLFHPEIVPIVSGLKDLGIKVKLDTVGTNLLGDSAIAYKGKGTASKVEVTEIAPHVDFVNIPLDGSRQETVAKFRLGRAELLKETRAIAGLLRNAGVEFGFNTVANTSNIDELYAMKDIVEEEGASEWQIFEYDPSGPNPSRKKDSLRLKSGQFDEATASLAWKPAGEGFRHIMGHITTDRAQVLAALRRHIQELR